MPYTYFFKRTNIVHWIGPRPKDSEKYQLYTEFSIINPWRVLEDRRRLQRQTEGKLSDLDIDTKAGPSSKRKRRSKKKGKAPTTRVTEVVAARLFNPHVPLRISEPREVVTVVVPPLA